MTYSSTVLWAIIAVAGLCTYACRAGFIFLSERVGALPPSVERALPFVPAAVLAALVAPSFLARDGQVALTLADGRLPAGIAAFLVAWVTENMLATIAVGMVVFWGIRFLT
jgi:branched-subunit amino acid transport protein